MIAENIEKIRAELPEDVKLIAVSKLKPVEDIQEAYAASQRAFGENYATELRDALKANGIGRPSTRAAIIETLYKRNYISKVRKSLEPTPTGIALIGVIQEELLKSAELTGQWEKKLRDIEAHKYSAAQFIDELKQMVMQVVQQVMADGTRRMEYS